MTVQEPTPDFQLREPTLVDAILKDRILMLLLDLALTIMNEGAEVIHGMLIHSRINANEHRHQQYWYSR